MSDPRARVEYMFDTDRPGSVFAAVLPPADVAASPAEPARVPLERVEAQICELAGHLAAATCRFLVLLADFDARRGWASWEMRSEEHTSELQSPVHLVCRLLLEKKKNNPNTSSHYDTS